MPHLQQGTVHAPPILKKAPSSTALSTGAAPLNDDTNTQFISIEAVSDASLSETKVFLVRSKSDVSVDQHDTNPMYGMFYDWEVAQRAANPLAEHATTRSATPCSGLNSIYALAREGELMDKQDSLRDDGNSVSSLSMSFASDLRLPPATRQRLQATAKMQSSHRAGRCHLSTAEGTQEPASQYDKEDEEDDFLPAEFDPPL